jgi:hypothetical protein
MGIGRRPREVYRAYSEEHLLEGAEGTDLFGDEPAVTAGGADPYPPAATSSARRARALSVTLLATLFGLAVGLAVVSLVGAGKHPSQASSGRVSDGAPVARGAEAAAPGPRRALVTGRRAGARAGEWTVRHGRARWSSVPARPYGRTIATPAPAVGERPVGTAGGLAGAPVAAAERPPVAAPTGNPAEVLGLSAREIEFGFER